MRVVFDNLVEKQVAGRRIATTLEGMKRRKRVFLLVREIQNLTHRVTRYTAFELKRHHFERPQPRPKVPAMRRKSAAKQMREWRQQCQAARLQTDSAAGKFFVDASGFECGN